MMVVTQERITEEQFRDWPKDGPKVELVNGEVVEVPTSLRHEDIGANLMELFFLAGARKHGRVFGSSAGYRMTNGNIRVPDLSFMRRERLPDGKAPDVFGDGAPDLAVEVISPSERRAGIYGKLAEYFESGAQQVWLIHPEARTLTVYDADANVQTLAGEDTLTAGDLIPGFSCPVADLFSEG